MALTPEQISRQLEDIGTDMPRAIFEELELAARLAIREVRLDVPIDSGKLRQSINASIIDDQYLGITMLDYGWFQNFGVKGTKNDTTQFGVSEIVKEFLPPRQGSTYSFNPNKKMIGGDLPFGVRVSIHQKGINAQNFINIEELVDRVVELVNQNLEL
jgi:hypothetical protein